MDPENWRMNPVFILWKQRHGISDVAFEELIQLQSIESSLHTSLASETLPAANTSLYDDFFSSSPLETSTGLSDDLSTFYYTDPSWNSMSTVLEGFPVDYGAAQLSWVSDTRTVQIPQPRRSSSSWVTCARCWVRKTKCEIIGGEICTHCRTSRIQKDLCIQVRVADETVFSKWNNSAYGFQLAWADLAAEPQSSVYAELGHFIDGPSIEVECCMYIPQTGDESLLFYKTGDSWASMSTTPYALSRLSKSQIIDYVTSCMMYLLHQTSHSSWLSEILVIAKRYIEIPFVRETLQLWAAHQILMKGWGLSRPGALGMNTVYDRSSTLHNTIPAPRVLQNQLDQILEKYCASTEVECLKELQRQFRTRQTPWVATCAVVGLLLHIRERDIWRLSSWTGGRNINYKWRHPDSAANLIKKSLHSCNVLLGHMNFAPKVPDAFSITSQLAKEHLGPAKDRYKWMDNDSLDFSLCSMVFARPRLASPASFDC